MDAFRSHAIHGLRNISRFHGRDTKQQFLPYLGFCLILVMLLSQVAAISMMRTIFRIGSSPQSADFGELWRRNALFAALFGAVLVVLMAASIARRLRDTGRSAWWGLLPVPFLIAAAVTMAGINIGDTIGDVSPDLRSFFIAFGLTWVYLASVGVLLWLVTRPSHYPPPIGRVPHESQVP